MLRRMIVVIVGGALVLTIAAPAGAAPVVGTWRTRGAITFAPGQYFSAGVVNTCLGLPTACGSPATRTGAYVMAGVTQPLLPIADQCNLSVGGGAILVFWNGKPASVITGRSVFAAHTVELVGRVNGGTFQGSLFAAAVKFRRLLSPCIGPFALGAAGKFVAARPI